ncbi:MAG: hypothetical protein JSU61_03590 [Fidelibacterota bacterium]|nr:MAG: hypothetical protein JSU61_03590 [Candidatus Neomarinimicrobiota bacterium]
MDPILTYIAPSMKSGLRLIQLTGTALILLLGCNGNGVEPSDDIPVLSNPQSSFNDRDNSFYAAITVTLPEGVSGTDTVWAEMYLETGILADSLGTDTALVDAGLVDNAMQGDILPQDGIFARKFDSPLPEGSGGSVRFEYYALIADDTSNVSDIVRLANLRPVVHSVTAADSIRRPPEGFFAIDTIRAEVSDPDGLEDIREVSFTTLKPDSTLGNQGQPLPLADNGLLHTWGDVTAGDGIYSIIINLSSQDSLGSYVYRVTAKDFGGLVSDTVRHTVVVH